MTSYNFIANALFRVYGYVEANSLEEAKKKIKEFEYDDIYDINDILEIQDIDQIEESDDE